MTKKTISADFPFKSHYVDIDGSKMHYIEEGEGDPILLLHGVPGSSYVWRNVIPHLAALGRCIAPDLMGFGKSDKPEIEYSITDHIKFLEKLIESLNLKKIIIVMHGWGSILGFDYATRHPDHCSGLVFYESYLRPVNSEELSLPYQEQILAWKEQDNINDVMMNGVQFVDKVLSQSVMRDLTDQEMKIYREPFEKKGSGKPLSQYLKEIPNGDKKNAVTQIIANYSEKLKQSPLPKLMLYSVPGFITTISEIIWAKENLPHLEMVDIGEELHYAQESDPALMGETISIWLQGVEREPSI